MLMILPIAAAFSAADEGPVAELEAKLLNAPQVILAFEVTASGAVAADLKGSLMLKGNQEASLLVAGSFAGQAIDLMLLNSDTELQLGPVDSPVSVETPDSLRESIIIGLTRMGVLHNIARLISGSPPDHSEGGVQEWVTTESAIKSTDGRSLSFNIVVDGQPSGAATLRLDPFGMVVKREQTVEFPEGVMIVTENYSNIQVSF